jgi:hypothetical protein
MLDISVIKGLSFDDEEQRKIMLKEIKKITKNKYKMNRKSLEEICKKISKKGYYVNNVGVKYKDEKEVNLEVALRCKNRNEFSIFNAKSYEEALVKAILISFNFLELDKKTEEIQLNKQ